MEITFPDIPLYQGMGAPSRVEADIKGLELISGSIPKDLNGTWYRGGPDRQYPSMWTETEDIFIDGEGMAFMWRFDQGHVEFRNRWVHTTRYEMQDKARRSLFGRYRNRYTNDPSVSLDTSMGTANTTVVFHAGKTLILKEDDLPYEIDPDTLATKGRYDYGGQIKSASLSAHPKVDWARDELLTYSYQAKGDGTTDMAYFVIDAKGKVVHEVWFQMPFSCNVHDFGVTETHVIFPFFPLITHMDLVKKGGGYYNWTPDAGVHFAVLPRRGTADQIRWFKGPAVSAGHMMNAFSEGNKVHLDVCLYDGNCFPFFTTPEGESTPPVPPILTRLTFDLDSNSDSFERKQLCPAPCEMPRTDDRYQGVPYRYGFTIMARAMDGSSAIGRIDHKTGKIELWEPGPGAGVQEPQFVPRSPDSPEGDGYVLTLVSRHKELRSELAILDAQNLSAGPLALLRMPIRIRATFHGTWAPADVMARGTYNFPPPRVAA